LGKKRTLHLISAEKRKEGGNPSYYPRQIRENGEIPSPGEKEGKEKGGKRTFPIIPRR